MNTVAPQKTEDHYLAEGSNLFDNKLSSAPLALLRCWAGPEAVSCGVTVLQHAGV